MVRALFLQHGLLSNSFYDSKKHIFSFTMRAGMYEAVVDTN
jgi:hypothetical protein